MLREKLIGDIETQRKNVQNVQKIVSMRSVSNNDIAGLKQKVRSFRLLVRYYDKRYR